VVLPPLLPHPLPQENPNLNMGCPFILSFPFLNFISFITSTLIPTPLLFLSILSCPHPLTLLPSSIPLLYSPIKYELYSIIYI
jgi:hypothetical protein